MRISNSDENNKICGFREASLKIMRVFAEFAVIAGMIFGIGSRAMAAEENVLYTNPDTGYTAVIEDGATLLTSDSELQQVLDSMMPVTEYGDVCFYTTLDSGGSDSATKNLTEEVGFDYFGNGSWTVLMIAMDTRYIYVYSHGDIYSTVTRSKAEDITDNAYTYASAGVYYACAVKIFDQMNTLLQGSVVVTPMRYIVIVLVAVLVALLINFIVVSVSSTLKRTSDDEILSTVAKRATTGVATVTPTGSHKRYSPISSGGGGGGGGGGHSGGGGGGGHSGGGGGGHHF